MIRQAITRAIADQARTIRIPVHMVETSNKLIRVSRQLLQELGREPTPVSYTQLMALPVIGNIVKLRLGKKILNLRRYLNKKTALAYGYWKDTGVRLEGDAVRSLTVMFLEMWNAIKGTDTDYTPCLLYTS